MTGETFESFVHWQKAKENRAVKVFIEGKPGHIQVWAYDYDLGVGQFVSSVAEIDLQKRRNEQLDEMIAEREKSRSMDQLL